MKVYGYNLGQRCVTNEDKEAEEEEVVVVVGAYPGVWSRLFCGDWNIRSSVGVCNLSQLGSCRASHTTQFSV